MSYVSHFTVIESTAARFPQKSAFRLPLLDIGDETPHQKINGWKDITYGEFHRDIIWCAGYWLKKLQSPHGSVVGLWMSGTIYRDFVHLFGLMKAGFIPQVLTSKVLSIEVATGYFKQSDILHVIHASSIPAVQLKDFQIHELIEPSQTDGISDLDIAPLPKEENADDTVLISHTSGSTGGKPKLVPYSRKWIDVHARKPLPGLPDGKAIGMNGVVHSSQFIISLQQFKNGTCLVLMPWLDFTGAELTQIITECKANMLYQLTPIFGKVIREAMTNNELRAALKSLNFVVYGGSAFGDNERLWAIENGIPLKNAYGATEMGIAMVSNDDPTILHPIKLPGIIHEFISQKTEIETKESKNKLVELVISPSSLDCPYSSLCSPDGGFHTRDLFEEVEPNGFVYRGRLDDAIMMNKGQRCDTLFLESQVLLSCKDLISVCVVVGSGKPSPVLLAEPREEVMDTVLLKEKIGRKVELVNKDAFPHERIRRSDILILPPGALPRTPKGNINRGATERLFQQDIDAFFNE